MEITSKVSIIIPTRNSARYLDDILRSINDQTYKNIETIIVDNFSSDQTLEIAEKYKTKIIKFPKKGDFRSAQRNLGAQHSSGALILFLDSDAELTNTVIEECANLSETENYDMVIIPEKQVGTGFWAKSKALERQCYLGDDDIEAPWFFKKDSFLEAGGYDFNLIAGEDWDLFNRMRNLGYKYTRCKSFIKHHTGNLSYFEYINKKRYYGNHIRKFIGKNKQDSIKKIPIFRKAYIKNLKLLIGNPQYSVGFLLLKLGESLFLSIGIIEQKFKHDNSN